jgi:hypothetical protein
MMLLRHLGEIVDEADQAEAQRHQQHGPHVGIGEIGPQERCYAERDEDDEPAHGGRAFFCEQMPFRTVGADGLALALLLSQPADEGRADQERHDHGGEHRAAGAEGDVVEEVEELRAVFKLAQQLQH